MRPAPADDLQCGRQEADAVPRAVAAPAKPIGPKKMPPLSEAG